MHASKLPSRLRQAIEAEQRRALECLVQLVTEYPQHGIDTARALLAACIASTSIVGRDVDRFLVETRQRVAKG
jgi:hypothetical protein